MKASDESVLAPIDGEAQRRASTPDPDVLWSPHGIDALIWTDTEPFADVLGPPPLDPTASLSAAQVLWLGRS